MKILVTVGTTAFESLIRKIDEIASNDKVNSYIFQCAHGVYIPSNGVSFKFSDDIENYYNDSDVVITHAGAGTIYRLLELRKKIIIVPNLERVDKHQADISEFMEEKNHALVSWSTDELESKIIDSIDFLPSMYKKDSFFKYAEIADFLLGLK